MSTVTVSAPGGVPEVRRGDDLVGLLLAGCRPQDGDVVVVTSKVVSKAEGRVRPGSRDDALPGETRRVVARRGGTTIVRTAHGLTLAAAGIDASNVEQGTVVLLPEDPDASARRLRAGVRTRAGSNVGVVVTDTAGRAWREGQTDIAVGAAGLVVLERFAGRSDPHGNPLVVTAPAVADQIAGMAELAQGKLAGRPFALVRGRPDLVLPPDDEGPGAVALVRPEDADLFGYGAREAVLRALRGEPTDQPAFGAPAAVEELVAALMAVLGDAVRLSTAGDELVCRATSDHRSTLMAIAFAHGWVPVDGPRSTRDAAVGFRPRTP